MVTTLTKRMAEDLTRYLMELGIKVNYLHSDVETLERIAILRDFRMGVFDVLIGINLLREGLDIPECSAVAILDADKEGFLRSQTSLIQTIGRAARNLNGMAILYADKITDSLRWAIDETKRRRAIQQQYNEEHGIEPASIIKSIDSDLVQHGESRLPRRSDARPEVEARSHGRRGSRQSDQPAEQRDERRRQEPRLRARRGDPRQVARIEGSPDFRLAGTAGCAGGHKAERTRG